MGEKKLKASGFSLSKQEESIIAEANHFYGLKNLSAALRLIINQWSDMHNQRVRMTQAGQEALEETRKKNPQDA